MTKVKTGVSTQATETQVPTQKNYEAKLKARVELQNKMDKENETAKAEKLAKKRAPGVIQTIFDTIVASKKKGITAEGILDVLSETFPKRDASSMSNTIKAQIGGKKALNRMEREKNIIFDVVVNKEGKRLFSYEA